MPAPYDFHIHTTYLKCANETMTVPAILQRHAEQGLETIAITDHLNAPRFLEQNLLIRRDLQQIETPLEVFFGAEANVINQDTGEISVTPELAEQGGFELIIGGVHSSYHQTPDKHSIVDLQQRLMLQVIANPLVDVLVHPWWFPAREFETGGPMEWFSDMSDVSDEYARELGEAALAHDTAIEANWSAIWGCPSYSPDFCESYNHYFQQIAATGCRISIATDAHDISQLDGIHPLMAILESIGISREQLWRPMRR